MNSKKNTWDFLGFSIGFAAVILGAALFVISSNIEVNGYFSKYGADFYTDMYGVTRQVVQAVKETTIYTTNISGAFFIFAGLIDICLFGKKIFR